MVIKYTSQDKSEDSGQGIDSPAFDGFVDSVDFFTRSFHFFGKAPNAVAILADADDELVKHVMASFIAFEHSMGVGKVEKRLKKELSLSIHQKSPIQGVLHSVYRLGRDSMMSTYEKWDKGDSTRQTLGGACADSALTRLFATYDAAALLFAANSVHEGLSLCKVLLEQLSWSLGASSCRTLMQITEQKSSKCISRLKRVFPKAGRLYGLLCRSAHLDLEDHASFFGMDGMVALRHPQESLIASTVLLDIADIWCAVFEKTQSHVLREYKCWTLNKCGVPTKLREDREMLSEIKNKKMQVIDAANMMYPTIIRGWEAKGLFYELFCLLGYEVQKNEYGQISWVLR